MSNLSGSQHLIKRLRITITGFVQGVGFRPYVYRLAQSYQLTGWICNDANGVTIEIQGNNTPTFIDQLTEQLPPLAAIETIKVIKIPVIKEDCFQIMASQAGNFAAKISPDMGVCSDCLVELFDSQSRYYGYPFINCTQCGPRYSITRQLPYDRQYTSMAGFALCTDCRTAYQDPANRRYHAEPIACNVCGPKLTVPIETIAAKIRQGEIIAVKSTGGYQLICDAARYDVIEKLRCRKNRAAKPFAIMVLNLASARQYVTLNDAEAAALVGQERPIVLAKKTLNQLPNNIAPELNTLGIMLPNNPMHYLLFAALLGKQQDFLENANNVVLIVTSANPGSCPMITTADKAEKGLHTIADSMVHYNRDIINSVDDSVVKIIQNKQVFIRKARGFAPRNIKLAREIPCTLGFGAYLKNTICITRGDEAFLSPHIGSLTNHETIEFYHRTIDDMLKILNVKPERAAHDLHPDYYSTRLAESYNLPKVAVQHHHAHLAAVIAEHQLTEPVLGLALDGFGLGIDGTSWGGELFLMQSAKYQRLGHLLPIALPGGDIAIREPWRIGVSILWQLDLSHLIPKIFNRIGNTNFIMSMLAKQFNCPLTSSCGRLFDGAAALLGLCDYARYEAQAPMLLEAQVTSPAIADNSWQIQQGILNILPLFKQLLTLDPVSGANLFHGTLAAALIAWVKYFAKQYNIATIVLAGGCMLNKILTELLISGLQQQSLRVYMPQQSLANDGGISLGQVWVAGQEDILCV